MKKITIILWAVMVVLAAPGLAAAYIGPGVGLTTIGTALALICAVFLGILGFFWYPVKRLINKIKNGKSEA